MNLTATGQLISQARKAKGLTQKQLAEQLNLSDRTISRWERGVGFPDISLLEPLSDTLDIPVLDLLRGERRETETTPEEAAKETLDAASESLDHTRRVRRKHNLQAALIIFILLVTLLQTGLIFRPVSFVSEAGVYENGLLTDSTYVKLQGRIVYCFPFRRHFVGRIQTPHAQSSMSEDYSILWRFDILPGKLLSGGSSLRHNQKYPLSFYRDSRDPTVFSVQSPFVFSFFMKDFSFRLNDGRVIATSEEMYQQLARHIELPTLQKPQTEPEY